MALKFWGRLVLLICSAAAVLAIILGAVSIGRTITVQSGASCASGTFSVDFPFLVPDFRGICSSVKNAQGMLEGAVLLFGINGIFWPIYYYFFLSNARFDASWTARNLIFGNDRPDADWLVRNISFVGSTVYIILFYQLELGETTGRIYSGEDSATSIERVVNAFSLVAIIGGGFQFALFNFRRGQSMLSGGENMDGGFNYVKM